MKYLLSIILLAVSFSAQATTYFYQASGVEQYQQAGQQMKALTFDVGNFSTLAACNAAVAAHSNLMMPRLKPRRAVTMSKLELMLCVMRSYLSSLLAGM